MKNSGSGRGQLDSGLGREGARAWEGTRAWKGLEPAMLQKPGSGSCKGHDYGTGREGEWVWKVAWSGGARAWKVSRVWVCEVTDLQGSWRGKESGMVQEPTVGSEKSLEGYRSLGGAVTWEEAGVERGLKAGALEGNKVRSMRV